MHEWHVSCYLTFPASGAPVVSRQLPPVARGSPRPRLVWFASEMGCDHTYSARRVRGHRVHDLLRMTCSLDYLRNEMPPDVRQRDLTLNSAAAVTPYAGRDPGPACRSSPGGRADHLVRGHRPLRPGPAPAPVTSLSAGVPGVASGYDVESPCGANQPRMTLVSHLGCR